MSTAPPPLPVVWRPHRGRLVTHGFAAVVLVLVVVLAVVLPHNFQLPDRIGFLVVGAGVSVVLYLLGRCRLRADADGLTVVNVLRTTELEWAEVLGATLKVGDPWVVLDLDDGETLPTMGIQAADGERARVALVQLRELISAHGEAPA